MSRAFTLLELLAVVLVLALIAGAAVGGGLGRPSARERPLRMCQEWELRLRDRARLAGGLAATLGERGVVACPLPGGEPCLLLALPEGVAMAWQAGGAAIDRIVIDGGGMSEDRQVVVEGAQGRRFTARIDGLSGDIVPLEDGP